MSEREFYEAILERVGAAGDPVADIGEAALALAGLDHPGISYDRYRRHIDKLAQDVALATGRTEGAAAKAEGLADVIAAGHGYVGDAQTYDDMQNADLMRVIDRRKGLPVALAILYMHAGREQGWSVEGLAFPAHFLIRLEADGGRVIVDPFHAGRLMTTTDLRQLLKRFAGDKAELDPAYYEPVPDRMVLLRLLNNIKTRALQAEDGERAADILHRMVAIVPEAAELWHELGVLNAHLGRLTAAIDALAKCVARANDPGLRAAAAAALERLERNIN